MPTAEDIVRQFNEDEERRRREEEERRRQEEAARAAQEQVQQAAPETQPKQRLSVDEAVQLSKSAPAEPRKLSVDEAVRLSKETPEGEEPGFFSKGNLIPLGIRVAGPLVGAALGGLPGAVGGAAAVEIPAQKAEQYYGVKRKSPVLEGAVNILGAGIPTIGLAKVGSPIIRGALGAAETAVGEQTLRSALVEGRAPRVGELAGAAGLGLAGGAAFGAVLPQRFTKAAVDVAADAPATRAAAKAAARAGKPVELGEPLPVAPARIMGRFDYDGPPLWELSVDELDRLRVQADAQDVAVARDALGTALGDEYTRLGKLARQGGSFESQFNAFVAKIPKDRLARLDDLENQLSRSNHPTPTAIGVFRKELGSVNPFSPDELANSLAESLFHLGGKTDIDPARMSFSEQLAFAKLRRGMEVANDQGWNLADISKRTINIARPYFPDPADAEFMLGRFIRPKPRPASIPQRFTKAAVDVAADAPAKRAAAQAAARAGKPVVLDKPLPDDLFTKTVDPAVTQALKNEALTRLDALKATPAGQRGGLISDQLRDLIEQGDVGMGIAERYASEVLGNPELAAEFRETIHKGAQSLGYMSHLARRLAVKADAMKGTPEAGEALDLLDDLTRNYIPRGSLLKFFDAKRVLQVLSIKNAARNAITQSARAVTGIVDESLQSFMAGESQDAAKALGKAYGKQISSLFRGRLQTKEFMEFSKNYPTSAARLVDETAEGVADKGVGKFDRVTYWANTLNRGQESFFRRAGFEGKWNDLISKAGLDPADIRSKTIGELPTNVRSVVAKINREAEQHARLLTFSESFEQNNWARNILATFRSMPFLYMITDYPRFMLNALKATKEFNPAGALRLLGPERTVTGELLRADPKAARTVLSRALIGKVALGAAVAFRNSEYAGEKWYWGRDPEDPDRPLDLRAYNPMVTVPLFLAEVMKQMGETGGISNLSNEDTLQGLLGLRRLQGPAKVAMEFFFGLGRAPETREDWLTAVQRAGGELLSGFTVPARLPKDIATGFSGSSDAQRDIRESPFLGPTLQNLPTPVADLFKKLPEKPSIYKAGPVRYLNPIMTQLSGVVRSDETPVSREVARLGLEQSTIAPRLPGPPELTRLRDQYLGPLIERYVEREIERPRYQELPDDEKFERMKELFAEQAKEAKALAMRDYGRTDRLLEERIEVGRGGGGLEAVQERKRLRARFPELAR